MSEPFRSSDEYDDRAHELYDQGEYDEAVEVLREALKLYPHAAGLHVGMGYARLAREEFAWARRSFEEALALDPEHEEALAGLAEVLLRVGAPEAARRCLARVLELGFEDDHELMLQVGRALFREGAFAEARRFFELAAAAQADSAEAAACVGYAAHRLGDDAAAFTWLRRAVEQDPEHAEARAYLANLHYDRGEYEAALYHLERVDVEEHVDELTLWRTIELKKSLQRLADGDSGLRPLLERLSELAGTSDPTEALLSEIAARGPDGVSRDPNQLELFGAMLTELQGMQQRPAGREFHRVALPGGTMYVGTFEEIVLSMKEDDHELWAASVQRFMIELARRGELQTGIPIPATDPESFIRASARAGLLRLIH